MCFNSDSLGIRLLRSNVHLQSVGANGRLEVGQQNAGSMSSSICTWFLLLFPQKRSIRKESIAFVPFVVGVVSLLSACFKAPPSISGSPILFLSTLSILFAHCTLRVLVAVLLGHSLLGNCGTLPTFIRPFYYFGVFPCCTASLPLGVQSISPVSSSAICMQAIVAVSMVIGSIIALWHFASSVSSTDTCLSLHSDVYSCSASPLYSLSSSSSISFDRAGSPSCAHSTSLACVESVEHSPWE